MSEKTEQVLLSEIKSIAKKKQSVQGHKKEALKKLNDKDLIKFVSKQFQKDHIGDEKGLLMLFFSSLSGFLPEDYRFSTAIVGDSSEGKTDAQNTIIKYLPAERVITANRITEAALEDIVENKDIIFFREFNKDGANGQIIDTIKSMVEDGIDSFKMDAKKNFKAHRHIKAEKKVGIYTTTNDSSDDELRNRYVVVPITGSEKKYATVIKKQRELYSSWQNQYIKREREKGFNWLTTAIKQLEHVDFIEIPPEIIIDMDNSKARAMRDHPRFMNLIAAITWFFQKQRGIQDVNVSNNQTVKIITATQKDYELAIEIGADIFNSSYYVETNPRNEETYRILLSILQDKNTVNENDGGFTEIDGRNWISRVKLQRKMGYDSPDGIKKRLQPLIDMGAVETKLIHGNKVIITAHGNRSKGTHYSTPYLPHAPHTKKGIFSKGNRSGCIGSVVGKNGGKTGVD